MRRSLACLFVLSSVLPAAVLPAPAPPLAGPTAAASPPASTPPPASVRPEPAPPRHRIFYQTSGLNRFNPLGAIVSGYFMYEYRLSERKDWLLEGTHVSVGVTPSVAPSIVRIGGTVEFVPLAFLQLKATYSALAYFGRAPLKIQDFASPTDDFGPNELLARFAAKQGRSGAGSQAELTALLRAELGPVELRNELTFYYSRIHTVGLPPGHDLFYDPRNDILAPLRGWYLGDEAELLHINPRLRFTAGLRASYFHSFYPDAVWEPTDITRDDTINDMARIGPTLSYSFKDRPARRFMKPTIFLVAQWWIVHRYRIGHSVSQALPMVVIGFSFTGDLWHRT